MAKFSGAATATGAAPEGENVARRCARWNALIYRPLTVFRVWTMTEPPTC
jgi:hypothetical protein